jgi:pimeloyl-ACP methyl ester carboxylesterase
MSFHRWSAWQHRLTRESCVAAMMLAVGASAAGQPAARAVGETRFVSSRDGTRIAYDVGGAGPVLMLLHGGGQTRRMWHELGYVERLRDRYTVVAVDIRGNGESDKPTAAAAHSIDRLCEDLLAVADAVGAPRFSLWGFSYGANVARYLGVRTDRIDALAIIGIPFGPAASGVFRQTILDLRAKWLPVLEAERNGRFDAGTLADADRTTWQRGRVALDLAWLSAMLEWPPVEPGELRCRTLWLVGTANAGAMESVRALERTLAKTRVTLETLPGFTHPDEIMKIDEVLPRLEKFMSGR